jgi:hypothetical protein
MSIGKAGFWIEATVRQPKFSMSWHMDLWTWMPIWTGFGNHMP